MSELLANQAFKVAVIAGLAAQATKLLSFMLLEKRVNFRRFAETDGSPNMHSAAFGALTLYIGLADGFGSIVFTLSLCLTTMVSVDIWNVKRAASQQAEVIFAVLDRLSKTHPRVVRGRQALSYTPIDVLTGMMLGAVITLLVI